MLRCPTTESRTFAPMHIRSTSVFAIFLAALVHFSGCTAQPATQITGSITPHPDWKPVVYLVQPRHFNEIAASFSGAVLDSAKIGADGRFVFPNINLADGQALLQLVVQKKGNRYPTQLADNDPAYANYFPLVLEKGKTVEVSALAEFFQKSFLFQNPSEDNASLMKLRDLRLQSWERQKHQLASNESHDEAALLDREDALLRFRQPLMVFADTSTLFWPAMVAVRWVSTAGDYERIPEFVFGQCEKWRKKRSDDPWTAQLCQVATREKLPVLQGDVIPDFEMPLASGDTVLLHSMLGSKLTILDIWASWCAPCRRENREVLAPIWNEHKQNGVQIIGYSIDSSPEAWRAAIAKDGAAWPHASHLSGDATPFMESLRITTIPANFILDAQGNVLAKNLHGAALKTFVEGY
ncbi:MAG: TlpA family protein disulfide reductase [Saprospiraceae bacterium]|nr:TlpA family protein disulfide reductase [Saprospiraceae bacterium]